MEIFKIVAQKVCHNICQMIYPIVIHQAVMNNNETTFEFDTIYNVHIKVEFGDNKIVVYTETNKGSLIYWGTDWTINDIADEIIRISKSFRKD